MAGAVGSDLLIAGSTAAAKLQREVTSWVIHVISSEQKRLPLFPQEPTFGCSTISVATGQQPTIGLGPPCWSHHMLRVVTARTCAPNRAWHRRSARVRDPFDRFALLGPSDTISQRLRDAEVRMSRLTVLLARFIGLFTVLLVAAFLIRGSATIETAISDGPVMLVYAIISLATGLAMILGHNVWSGGVLPVVVTLVRQVIGRRRALLAKSGERMLHLRNRHSLSVRRPLAELFKAGRRGRQDQTGKPDRQTSRLGL